MQYLKKIPWHSTKSVTHARHKSRATSRLCVNNVHHFNTKKKLSLVPENLCISKVARFLNGFFGGDTLNIVDLPAQYRRPTLFYLPALRHTKSRVYSTSLDLCLKRSSVTYHVTNCRQVPSKNILSNKRKTFSVKFILQQIWVMIFK